jgi:hypothetical protein
MRTRSAVLVASVLAAAGVATAVASIPGPDGTINGCYDPGNLPAPLSVVDAPAECKATLLPFHQTGPAGPAGSAGPAGPAGTLASSSRVSVRLNRTPDNDYSGTAMCPAGTILLGGGFELDVLGEGFDIVTSRPDVTVRGWDVTLKRRPGYVSSSELAGIVRDVLGGLPDLAAAAAAAAAALQNFRDGFSLPGLGGARLTKKEQARIGRAVKKAVVDSREALEDAKAVRLRLQGLPTGPVIPPEADPKAYALCGAA